MNYQSEGVLVSAYDGEGNIDCVFSIWLLFSTFTRLGASRIKSWGGFDILNALDVVSTSDDYFSLISLIPLFSL